MKELFLTFLSIFYFINIIFPSNIFSAEKELNFVVLANKGNQEALENWQPLAEYLKNKTGYKINLIPYNFLQIEASLKNKTADILLTNPNYFVMFQKRYSVKPVATLKTGEYPYLCGVIVAHKNSNIKKLDDIEGKKIAVVSRESAFGYLAQTALLLEKGIDIRQKNEIWIAQNQENVAYALLNNSFQVGFLNGEIYEKLVKEKKIIADDLVIINAHKNKEVPYTCSTDTWPDWTLYSSENLDENTMKKIQDAVLNISADNETKKSLKINGFVQPLDYSNLRKALDLLAGIEGSDKKGQKK